jgi:hypothetical protein
MAREVILMTVITLWYYEDGSKSFRPDQLFMVTDIKNFAILHFYFYFSLFSTHTDTDILTSP